MDSTFSNSPKATSLAKLDNLHSLKLKNGFDKFLIGTLQQAVVNMYGLFHLAAPHNYYMETSPNYVNKMPGYSFLTDCRNLSLTPAVRNT